jgi:type IV pilus assembly protein PilA
VRRPILCPSAVHHTLEDHVRKSEDDGFTLIELLVVVVIIGVLVAIAVPVYLNYRKGAADKSAQSDLRGAVVAVEQFYADNVNLYPDRVDGVNDSTGAATLTLTSTSTATPSIQTITLSDKTRLGYVKLGPSYLLCSTNTGGSGKWYLYTSANGGSMQAASTALDPTTCS